jgi:pyruvate,water dikinase
MKTSTAQILWFNEINEGNHSVVGDPVYNLSLLYKKKFPVSNGFALTENAFASFLEYGSFKNKLLTEMSGLDYSDLSQLEQASLHLKQAVISSDLPPELQVSLRDYYHKLSGEFDRHVNVFSSHSKANYDQSLLNKKGFEELLLSVKELWAAFYSVNNLIYCHNNNLSLLKTFPSIYIQLNVYPDVSGLAYSKNPLTNNAKEAYIEALIGEYSEELKFNTSYIPDNYIYSFEDKKIVYKYISTQKQQNTYFGTSDLSRAYRDIQKLEDKKIKELSRYITELSSLLGENLEIQWQLQSNKFYFEKIKVLSSSPLVKETDVTFNRKIIDGETFYPSKATGKIYIFSEEADFDKLYSNTILVINSNFSSIKHHLAKIKGLVIDLNSEDIPVGTLKKLKIPILINCKIASKVLQNGEVVLLDSKKGYLYENNSTQDSTKAKKPKKTPEKLTTALDILINISEPDYVGEVKRMNVRGIGQFFPEYIMSSLQKHPRWFIDNSTEEVFKEEMSNALSKVASAFKGSPVNFRFSDLRSFEYRSLGDGHLFETKELNPSLGLRGAARFLADPKLFLLEVEAIKHSRNKDGYKNINVILPYVRTPEEFKELNLLMSSYGLRRSGAFKVFMCLDVASNLIQLDEFIKLGVDGFYLRLQNLNQSIFGYDKSNAKLVNLYPQNNSALKWFLTQTALKAKESKLPLYISDLIDPYDREFYHLLVNLGVTGVSISPSYVDAVREMISEQELAFLKRKSDKSMKKTPRVKRKTSLKLK